MSYQGTSAQLDYLKKSAMVLNSDSPSTSAYLMTVHHQILQEQFKPANRSHKMEFCPSCGTIRLPSTLSVSTRHQAQRPSKRGKPTAEKDRQSNIVYNCLRCHRRSFHSFTKTNPRQKSKPANETPVSTPGSLHNMPSTEATSKAKSTLENASSKRRAKARRQQGLLASLAASKSQQSSTSTSLDLLDILQP